MDAGHHGGQARMLRKSELTSVGFRHQATHCHRLKMLTLQAQQRNSTAIKLLPHMIHQTLEAFGGRHVCYEILQNIEINHPGSALVITTNV